jgi:hypothetical protein
MLREEHELRVFENRVLIWMNGNDVTGEWRKLHNELRDSYFSSSIITIVKSQRMRWVGHVVWMGEKMNVYRLLVGRPRCRGWWIILR